VETAVRSAAAALLAAGLGLLAVIAPAVPYAPREGEPHPDFVLPRIDDGRPVRLSDFRGRKLLLIQFASW
jgi:hypothetical protein